MVAPGSAQIEMPPSMLRWQPMSLSPSQKKYAGTLIQYATVPAGRRTGKTEMSCRKIIHRAVMAPQPMRYFLGGPTYKHAKKLYWNRLQARLKESGIGWVDKSETDLTLKLFTGSEIVVVGFNEPARFDGQDWDGGVVDEFGDQKEEVWTEHIRPALMDAFKRGGIPFCYFIGVPAGRNHYWKMYSEQALNPAVKHWANYGWTTEEVLPLYLGEERAKIELDQIAQDLDTRTYDQEILGKFVTMSGLAYYLYDLDEHASFPQTYNPKERVDLCFDFNVEPGITAIVQERQKKTRVVGEIYIENNSNTHKICDKIIDQYEGHKNDVFCFGDATARGRGTAKVQGSDWDIIKKKLKPVFGDRLHFRVPDENPPVVARINAMNCRLKNTKGEVNYFIDPSCYYTKRDFEGTEAEDDGGIRKGDKWKYLTHITDALGYREAMEHPYAGKYRLEVSTI